MVNNLFWIFLSVNGKTKNQKYQGAFMYLSVFPSAGGSIPFKLYGYTISDKHTVLTENKTFQPKAFSDPFLFKDIDSARSYMRSNSIPQFKYDVMQVFSYLGCLGYASLSYDHSHICTLMDKQKSYFLNSDFS